MSLLNNACFLYISIYIKSHHAYKKGLLYNLPKILIYFALQWLSADVCLHIVVHDSAYWGHSTLEAPSCKYLWY